MRRGDIVLFKRSGPLAAVLAPLLRHFYPAYKGWGWHTAIVCGDNEICEAVAGGVRRAPIDIYGDTSYRVYRWFNAELPADKLEAWVNERLGCCYDVKLYVFAALYVILKRWFHYRLFRVIDDSYFCWELAFELADDFGKPVNDDHEYPLLPEFLTHYGGDVSPDGVYYPIV